VGEYLAERNFLSMERKHLSFGGLITTISEYAQTKIEDPRKRGGSESLKYSVSDCYMSAFAMFFLKYPSLLQFDEDARSIEDTITKHNIKNIFRVSNVPSDTHLREILDDVDPENIKEIFKKIYANLQRGNALEGFKYYEDYIAVAVDGTGCFSSQDVYCDSCCRKEHKNGLVTYYHQALAAVIVSPDFKIVLPIGVEEITKKDGVEKNDCELNAAKRLLPRIRRNHPHQKFIITEDALSCNGPHIKMLKDLKCSFIIACKPGGNKSLFEFIQGVESVPEAIKKLEVTHEIKKPQKRKGWSKEKAKPMEVTSRYRWVNDVPLNDDNEELLVNFLEYTGPNSKGEMTTWTFITDIQLDKSNVGEIIKLGRSRWKIENETFNTLKTKGFEFEHNFGHGEKYLFTNFILIMFLVFLVDQIIELLDKEYQDARLKHYSKKRLYEKMGTLFDLVKLKNSEEFFKVLSQKIKLQTTLIEDTS
jgi:hypothetical protein